MGTSARAGVTYSGSAGWLNVFALAALVCVECPPAFCKFGRWLPVVSEAHLSLSQLKSTLYTICAS